MLKSILRLVGTLLLVLILYIALVLIHGTYTDYQPVAVLPADATSTASEKVIVDSTLSFMKILPTIDFT